MGIFDWKHWIVILVVVVLMFGTKKLKNLGTDVGESIKGFKKAMNENDEPSEDSQKRLESDEQDADFPERKKNKSRSG